MLIKFCEAKHNLAKGCNTVGLGSMSSYAMDDPDFFRYDYQEGYFKITNAGAAVHLDYEATRKLTGGGLISPNGLTIKHGGTFTRNLQCPNCYVFCMSENVMPSLEIARELDPAYNDWYVIHDLQRFATSIGNLLMAQMLIADLDVSYEASFEWIRGLNLQIVHRACSYEGREMVFTQGTMQQAAEAATDNVQWAFAKNPEHNKFKEYRILFIFTDAEGKIVPVKQKAKVLKLLPDIGVSTVETNTTV